MHVPTQKDYQMKKCIKFEVKCTAVKSVNLGEKYQIYSSEMCDFRGNYNMQK